jgi:hypothetical protein
VTFDQPGTYDIYAVIDPENAVAEDNELNNVVIRTITVAKPNEDTTVPVVQSITITGDGSNTQTAQTPNVTLDVTAIDPEPNLSGMQSINIIEYEYNQGARQWIPIAQSDWLAYTTVTGAYRWSLQPSIGMHYLQVRAMDNAGNVSVGDSQQMTNYQPTFDRVERDETRVYRYTVEDGQSLSVALEVLEGDADLYVWSSREDQSAWVSNQSVGDEQVVIPASKIVPGVYQVEVYGYSAATYRLHVTKGSTQQIQSADIRTELSSTVAQEKPQPQAPVVPVASVPDARQGTIPAPQINVQDDPADPAVYLPLVIR